MEKNVIAYCGDIKSTLLINNIDDSLQSELIALPGAFDVHVHGGYGYKVFNKNKDLLYHYLRQTLNEGVSDVLITTLSASIEQIESYLDWIKDIIIEAPWLKTQMARIRGIHLEGPFINTLKKGAQNPAFIIKPSIQLIKKWQKISGNNIRLITFAPELANISFQEALNDLKIVASCGHSACPSKTLLSFIEKGLSHITHFYNAMPSLHHREVGIIGTAFTNDKLNCEIISDLIHTSPDALKILYKNIGCERLQVITDCVYPKGLVDGQYEIEGLACIKKNHAMRLLDGTLAGSISYFWNNVLNLKHLLNLNYHDITKIATLNQWSEILKERISFKKVFIKNKSFFLFSPTLKAKYYVNDKGNLKLNEITN